MKYYFSIAFLYSLFIFKGQEDTLLIKGFLKGQRDHPVSISFTDDKGKQQSLKVESKNGRFIFHVKKQEQPVIVRLNSALNKGLSKSGNGNTVASPPAAFEFFVYQEDLQIKGDAGALPFSTAKGDRENNELSAYRKSVRRQEERKAAIMKKVFFMDAARDSIEIKKLFAESHVLVTRQWELQKKFIRENPSSFTSVFLLSRMENLYTTADYEAVYQGLTDEYKHTALAKKLEKRIDFLSPTAKGKPAIPFTRTDKDGREIRLADYRGKVVLLDFWGSWCAPCRASHPHLKQLYAQYKDKGFEIIAIASEKAPTPEEQKKKWLAAIEKDGINWVHILNNDGREKQDLIREYRITAFPTKILLDQDGKILLRITASATDDIDKTLYQLLGNK